MDRLAQEQQEQEEEIAKKKRLLQEEEQEYQDYIQATGMSRIAGDRDAEQQAEEEISHIHILPLILGFLTEVALKLQQHYHL